MIRMGSLIGFHRAGEVRQIRQAARVLIVAVGMVLGLAVAMQASAAAPPSDIAGPAALATACSGTLIESRNLMYGTTKIGELDVYYNSSTSRNCARMNHAGPTGGKYSNTYVFIAVCYENVGGGNCTSVPGSGDDDFGSYAYYAGPVTTQASSRGRCIVATGYITYAGYNRWVQISPYPGHCG
jgi:hypothetical protein